MYILLLRQHLRFQSSSEQSFCLSTIFNFDQTKKGDTDSWKQFNMLILWMIVFNHLWFLGITDKSIIVVIVRVKEFKISNNWQTASLSRSWRSRVSLCHTQLKRSQQHYYNELDKVSTQKVLILSCCLQRISIRCIRFNIHILGSVMWSFN